MTHRRTDLLCARCHWHKDRRDFRETPWHGRAADCLRCEGDPWQAHQRAQTKWELRQVRETLDAYKRFVGQIRELEDYRTRNGRAHRLSEAARLRRREARIRAVLAEALRSAYGPLEEAVWQPVTGRANAEF